ncbi:hypothetical protein M378DRAFT_174567 [Amanita muscaria Koide BX008]|uniref:Uncharacterized protein n=1 Tax=Amanita muscaria (strain Koide BX008) TaxID=946122 RepID=A0A0C2SIJ6_AMAMK|nr:hypothetical protein M378DRAFT_174567 [Amanita muscaria Koide BX008]
MLRNEHDRRITAVTSLEPFIHRSPGHRVLLSWSNTSGTYCFFTASAHTFIGPIISSHTSILT